MSELTTTTETPVLVPVGDERAFAILNAPEAPTGPAVLVLATGANFGASPMQLRLARNLARHGFASLKLDYLGTGESSGGIHHLVADKPQTAEVEAAAHLLAERGYDEIVPVGLCYGARAALATMDRIPGLAGMVLIAPVVRARRSPAGTWTRRTLARRVLSPSRWRGLFDRTTRRGYRAAMSGYLRGARERRARSSDTRSDPATTPQPDTAFTDAIVALADRRIPVCLIFGSEDHALVTLQGAEDARLRQLLEPDASTVEVRVLPGPLYPLRGAAAMHAATDATLSWLQR